MQLVWPAAEYLASYVEALKQGWSPNNLRPQAAGEELDEIDRDASVRRDQLGLTYVELTTEPENVASQRVILANGGQLVEQFSRPVEYGGSTGLRYRIYLDPNR